MPKDKVPLREIQFGTLDASQEAADDPHLLLEGFFDYREAALGLAQRGRWLLLGQKGAGKTAVLEHLRLKWRDQWDRFFSIWDLRSFPVADVCKIPTGLSPGAARAQSSWEFVLLLRVLESLERDQGLSRPKIFDDLVKELSDQGLLGGEWPRKVARWQKNLDIHLKHISMSLERTSELVGPLDVAAAIKDVLRRIRSDSQHLIALDGLDSFFFEEDDEWRSLTGLLQAIECLNRFFKDEDLPIWIAAAVRSDIFNVLPSADLNKLKPQSVHLDWSAFGIGTGNKLWDMIDAKALVSRPQLAGKSIVETYLSTPIHIRDHHEIPTFLLDHTRLLPRDMIAIMTHIQEEHPGATPVTETEVKLAVNRYCREYFEGEVFDNLAGVLAPGNSRKLSLFKEALRTLDTKVFKYTSLLAELDGELQPSEIKSLLKQLFDIGGIGIRNISGGVTYTDFSYRSVNGAGFTIRRDFVLHHALARAWNRPNPAFSS